MGSWCVFSHVHWLLCIGKRKVGVGAVAYETVIGDYVFEVMLGLTRAQS